MWSYKILIIINSLLIVFIFDSSYPSLNELQKINKIAEKEQETLVYLKIISEPKSISRDLFKVDAELSVEKIKCKKTILSYVPLSWKRDTMLLKGSELLAKVKLIPLLHRMDKMIYPLDYEASLLRKGYFARLELVSVARILKSGRESPLSLYFDDLFKRFGDSSELALTIATIFGQTSFLDDGVKTIFRNTGLSHIIVVSGFHLGIVFLIFNFFVSIVVRRINIILLFMPLEIVSASTALIFVKTYCSLILFELSAQRAAIALVMVLYSRIICRNISSLRAVSFVFVILIIIYPCSFYEVGFQLTFAALLGLINAGYLLNLFKFKFGLIDKSYLLSGLKIFFYSVMPSIFTAPFLCFWFRQVVPLAFLFNIIFAWVLSVNIIFFSGLLLIYDYMSLPYSTELFAMSLKFTALIIQLLELMEKNLIFYNLGAIRLE